LKDVRSKHQHLRQGVQVAVHNIKKPYLLLIGDMENPNNAKTAFGLRDWIPDACIGQLRFNDRAVDLGLPQMSPAEAVSEGAKTLVIGIAPSGGQLPDSWRRTITEALNVGLDVAAGLHQRLSEMSELADCAARLGRQIHDVRHSDTNFPVGTGQRRSGRRLLTVGTDCALGKKYTALAIAKALTSRGHQADFRATGQTGILICGRGVAVDAVIGDFIAGAAEALSPANSSDHWDIIEGQGSLFHPAYAGVTLGLIHGSQPDAMVLCHDPTRKSLNGFPHMPVISLDAAIPAYLSAARLTNPNARFVGVSLNTSTLTEGEADKLLKSTSWSLGMPCVDPIRTGVDAIVAAVELNSWT
jgi:uncharacterized NAD-dependent epimerase/dehydratase family protein